MTSQSSPVSTARSGTNGNARPSGRPDTAPAPSQELLGDRFFRHLVFSLRTGMLAITRAGQVAAMNDLAYRVLGLSRRDDDIGRPFAEVLHDCPEIIRVLQGAFESDDLPNRAEMRLRRT